MNSTSEESILLYAHDLEDRYTPEDKKDKKICVYCGTPFNFESTGTLACKSYVDRVSTFNDTASIKFADSKRDQKVVVDRRYTVLNNSPCKRSYYIECDHRTQDGHSTIKMKPYIVLPQIIADKHLKLFKNIDYGALNNKNQYFEYIHDKRLLNTYMKFYIPTWNSTVKETTQFININLMKEYLEMVSTFNLINLKPRTSSGFIKSNTYYQYNGELADTLMDEKEEEEFESLNDDSFVHQKLLGLDNRHANKLPDSNTFESDALVYFHPFYVIRRSGFQIKTL